MGQSPVKTSSPSLQTKIRQQIRPARSYKIEALDDSGDEITTDGITKTKLVFQTPSQTLVQTSSVESQKRSAPIEQKSISEGQLPKRIKTQPQTIITVQKPNDSLETLEPTENTALETVQIVTSSDKSNTNPSYIEIPIELATKSEPDYTSTDEVVDIDNTGDDTFVEDDSYGDMKYDDSYFTESDEPITGGTSQSQIISKKETFGETFYDESGAQGQGEFLVI